MHESTRRSRRHWLRRAVQAAGVLPFAANTATTPNEARHAFSFDADIDDTAAGTPIARGLCGQNLQWVDGGDDLLDADGQWRAAMLDKVLALAPTALRFPGGAQSDAYHWTDGIGPLTERRAGRHFHDGASRASLMGTQEFLELCEYLGAEPMITVNVVTGSADQAAAWLRQVNVTRLRSRRTGQWLPKVPRWEIGNEPYLHEGDRRHWLTPRDFVRRANAFIAALRAVDPAIQIGVPLRTATLGGVAMTPMPDFAEQVMRGVDQRFDFIALHNAYLPYAYRGLTDTTTAYLATLAASATVERNLADVRDLVASLAGPQRGWQGQRLRYAITEYNGLYTLDHSTTDRLVQAPLTALYIADLLCMLAQQDDVDAAHHWSLSGNGMFGAIGSDARVRPNYRVLALMRQALQGVRLPTRVDAPRFDSPRLGAAAPTTAVPLVRALASRSAGGTRLVLLNKDRHRRARGTLRWTTARRGDVQRRSLTAIDPMRISDVDDTLTESHDRLVLTNPSMEIELAPASVTLMTWHA